MLLRLVGDLRTYSVESVVVSLQARERMVSSFEQLGVRVHCLGMTSLWKGARGLRELAHVLSRESPDLVQGWMYHGNAALSFARALVSQPAPLLWNIRRGLDDLRERAWTTRVAVALNRRLAKYADTIIYCTDRSMEQHRKIGFSGHNGLVIGNGFDLERFHPRGASRASLVERLGLSSDALIIGHIGRYDVAKGHDYLFRAFAKISSVYPGARLICAGRGVDGSNATLGGLVKELGLESRTLLIGECARVEDIYPAFDILCSSSIAEGFPNVVAEAMASGVPCVVTDTGASRALVEGIGVVVEPRSSAALASGLHTLCAMETAERRRLGLVARERIQTCYSIKSIAQRYAGLYERLTHEIGS
jgi:glycosyltransferase involved in cell wall biosynthesis